MPTVLVPLDETAFAETVLPDARELAGPGGRIVLVYVAGHGEQASDAERYLANEAELLQTRGLQASIQVLIGGDIPRAIDEGVRALGANMVAVATHGTSHRLARSSIAWKTLAHSPVPILLRHAQFVRELDEPAPQPVIIVVPLDGSSRAEQALPVATALATQWQGSLLLAHVGDNAAEGQAYLDRIARTVMVPVKTVLAQGRPGDALVRLAQEQSASYVVMTSHGRTGLSRVIAGDVAAQLIDRLSLPIVVVPALAAQDQESRERQAEGRDIEPVTARSDAGREH